MDNNAQLEQRANQLGFEQFVQSFSQHLRHTPAGWTLVFALSWGTAPPVRLFAWLALFVALWIGCLALCAHVRRHAALRAKHRRHLMMVALLDGLGWGATPWAVAGVTPMLDAWLLILLCGLAALSAIVYLNELRLFSVYLAAILAGIAWSSWAIGAPDLRLVGGIALFDLLLLQLLKPVSANLLKGRLAELELAQLAARLRASLSDKEREAATDALTGLANRRALEIELQEATRADRRARSLAVLLIDIDHFKSVNDQHGHATGDAVLKEVACRLREQLRQQDFCARHGGEEFAVLLPDTSQERAREVAERLRNAVGARPLSASPLIRNTISIGVSLLAPADSPASLLARADAALYAAKAGGRNRVQLQ